MSKKTTDNDKPELQRFVFGLDEAGKPIGARFPLAETNIVKVANDRKLECHTFYDNADWAALCMQLPVGRVYARGKAFLPSIKTQLYDKLQASLASCREQRARSQAERTAAAAATNKTTDNSAAAKAQPGPGSGLPQSWQEIAPGHLVLANDPPGYWESIVVARDGDVLTLRYRDYPKSKPFTRHVGSVGLLNSDRA
jgi:hypothetical protein